MKHKDILSKLTLAEKCALLSGADVWHTHNVARLNIPAITLSDGPSGLRKQAGEGDHNPVIFSCHIRSLLCSFCRTFCNDLLTAPIQAALFQA